MSYAVCLLVLLILQLTVVVLLFTNKDKFNSSMGEVIDKAWASREVQQGGVFDALQKSVSERYQAIKPFDELTISLTLSLVEMLRC